MTTSNDTHILIAAFVDELVRCGMTDACTSPGSRCAPLVLALAREPRLRAHSHLDERAAGFFALGAAKASGLPVAIACTSGTAAANFAPAVIEAHEARVPLIVLTADRPPELRDAGAGQTIDQLKIYGTAPRWFFEVGTHDATPESVRWIRGLACRAYWTALGDRPGPVHLNWPLRDPLVPGGPLPPAPGGRPGGRPWISRDAPPPGDPGALQELVGEPRRGVVVAGRCDRGLAPAAPEFAARAGYPLLADPLSGARRGPAAVAHYDLLLRDPERLGRPELVIRVGDLPTSKPLRTWLAGLACPQVSIDRHGAWRDPDNVVERSLRGDPRTLLAGAQPAAADPGWLAAWRAADAAAASAIAETLGDELSEPAVAALLVRELPAQTTLFTAASMPVRDLETFAPVREDGPRVLSNRGANGIDGTISSAFGAAVLGPTVLLIGDVALAHDIGGLLAARRLPLELTIVAIDNGGGGIFDFLAVSGESDVYEQHIATPTGIDCASVAELFGLEHVRAQTLAELREALLSRRGALIEVRSDRAHNRALHARVAEATHSAAAAAPGA